MREIIGNLHNEFMVLSDNGELMAVAEIILMVSEPVHDWTPERGLTSKRRTYDVRFSGSAAKLRSVAEAFHQIAGSLERLDRSYGRPDAAADVPSAEAPERAGRLCAQDALVKIYQVADDGSEAFQGIGPLNKAIDAGDEEGLADARTSLTGCGSHMIGGGAAPLFRIELVVTQEGDGAA
jgi:hypothetical protein